MIHSVLFRHAEEQPIKRPASPHEKGEKIDYLIRDELDRACPTLVRHEGKQRKGCSHPALVRVLERSAFSVESFPRT